MKIGSIEAGGTKFICAIGDETLTIKDSTMIPTTTPEETLAACIAYFKPHHLDALGIATFGPIGSVPTASDYGYITTTPKPGWQNVNFLGMMKHALHIPMTWTTDVNGSAYGEYALALRHGQKIDSLAYYTIGTGVGAGVVINGQFLGQLGSPEMGHVYVHRHPDDLAFKGICPYHHDCLEGLIAGPTFEARLGQKGADVPHNDPVWQIMAYYTAQAAIQTTLTIRPDQIVFGGSVVNPEFLTAVRHEFATLLDDYVPVPDLQTYLTQPAISNNGSATIGNFALAAQLGTQRVA